MTKWDDLDTEFRGKINEDGLQWDYDIDAYVPNDWVNVYHVSGDETEGWHCYFMVLGKGNVQITEGEDKKMRALMPDNQEYYKWLFENRRIGENG